MKTGLYSKGIALVLTLAMLVLLSGIVVALLTSVRTDLSGSRSYEDSTSARMLADSALHLVIGQIREASTRPQTAWISQPGLIRTFTTDGNPDKAFKLYSANELVVTGNFDPAADAASGGGDLPPAVAPSSATHWSKKPALWTDINEPVADLSRTAPSGSGPRMSYPIFDANYLIATDDPTSAQLSLVGDKQNPDVEGFRVEEFDRRAATMPVKWLYMLKDGTLVPVQEKATGDAELILPPGADKTPDGRENSIVARVAFWTDDETAKVNINTASEGTFWDTPVANTQPGCNDPVKTTTNYLTNADALYEWDLAERAGGFGEYARYPGHPAQTCLSTVFGAPLARALGLTTKDISTGLNRAKFVEEIMKIVPRVSGKDYNPDNTLSYNQDYSSRGGTVRAGTHSITGWQTNTDYTLRQVVKDNDRLYANVDEMTFMSPAIAKATNSGTSAERPSASLATNGSQDFSRELLAMSSFFLTASSKAPEQNLFNLPRVSIWPVRDELNRRTAFDRVFAFCSTVGSKASGQEVPLLFQRNRPDSSVWDWDKIPNNQRVYNYLKSLTSRLFPGWKSGGMTFSGKYQQDNDQILTEIFDYIRCTNLVDESDPTIANEWYTDPAIALATSDKNTNEDLSKYRLSKRGQVTPIVINDTRGFGRIATVSELALVLVRKPDTLGATNVANIECSLLPEVFCPMAGYSCLPQNIRLQFKNINISCDGQKFPSSANSAVYDIGRLANGGNHESKLGGVIGVRSLLEGRPAATEKGSPKNSLPPSMDIAVTTPVDLAAYSTASGPQPGPDMNYRISVGGSVDVEVWAPGDPADPNREKIQEFTFVLPTTSVPIPGLVSNPKPTAAAEPWAAKPGEGAYDYGEFVNGSGSSASKGLRLTMPTTTNNPQNNFGVERTIFDSKMIWSDANGDWVPESTGTLKTRIANTGDSVRSVTATGVDGDLRLVAAQSKLDSSYFGAISGTRYFDNTKRLAHSLRGGFFKTYEGFDAGSIVQGMVSSPKADIPEGIIGVKNSLGQSGDWDNGPAWLIDGPLINKADEGTNRHDPTSYEQCPYIGHKYVGDDYASGQPTFFSPNRQLSSAVMFGSLPTGVKRKLPWQTLLFRPATSYFPGGTSHPGAGALPDHLLLDLFWMPIVEPYPISEPFATAGKINLNTQMVPFTNIKRNTGLHAVLKAVKLSALNPDQMSTSTYNNSRRFGNNYKTVGMKTAANSDGEDGAGDGIPVRRNIDVNNTVKQIEDRLQKNRPFVSASEICEIPMIPTDMTELEMKGTTTNPSKPAKDLVNVGFSKTTPLTDFETKLSQFWAKHKLTGDNSLERPYSFIYPRLTTRSNSYTVHVRVQVLKKASNDRDKFVFKNNRDQVTGEFRGSFQIERYLDPNLAGFVKGANEEPTTESDPDARLGPYRFRVVSSKQFTP